MSRRSRERGSVLLLMPAGVLAVLALGAIAVDLTVVHLGEREARSAAIAATNDAVTVGIDLRALHDGRGYRLDPDRVAAAVERAVALQELSGRAVEIRDVRLSDRDGDGATDTVTVTVAMHVDYVFARSLPGSRDGRTVVATASASAVRR